MIRRPAWISWKWLIPPALVAIVVTVGLFGEEFMSQRKHIPPPVTVALLRQHCAAQFTAWGEGQIASKTLAGPYELDAHLARFLADPTISVGMDELLGLDTVRMLLDESRLHALSNRKDRLHLRASACAFRVRVAQREDFETWQPTPTDPTRVTPTLLLEQCALEVKEHEATFIEFYTQMAKVARQQARIEGWDGLNEASLTATPRENLDRGRLQDALAAEVQDRGALYLASPVLNSSLVEVSNTTQADLLRRFDLWRKALSRATTPATGDRLIQYAAYERLCALTVRQSLLDGLSPGSAVANLEFRKHPKPVMDDPMSIGIKLQVQP